MPTISKYVNNKKSPLLNGLNTKRNCYHLCIFVILLPRLFLFKFFFCKFCVDLLKCGWSTSNLSLKNDNSIKTKVDKKNTSVTTQNKENKKTKTKQKNQEKQNSIALL